MAACAGTAHAQSPPLWADRAEVGEKLKREYQEAPTGMGLAANGGMVELFESPNGETWTILITMPNGLSRIVVVGKSWSKVPEKDVTARYEPIHGAASWIMESDDTRPCCGPEDCEALPYGSVQYTGLGWRLPNGIVWPEKRRDNLWRGRSVDRRYWVCWNDPKQKHYPRCLFTPKVES